MWHTILGHYDTRKIQKLLQATGHDLIPAVVPKLQASATCSIPMCRSCLRGKGKLTPNRSIHKTPNPEKTDTIKADHLHPGDCVSTDQFECRVKGRLPHTRGKEDPESMYSGGTIFIDHASGYIIVHHQVSLGGSDTVRSKELYEIKAAEHGIQVKSYRGDNGVYKCTAFKDDVTKRKQTLTLSGVGAHGQNGVAERSIGTVVNSARTMMLHQALLWPEQFDMRLLPFALSHAVYLWNRLPHATYPSTPLEIYTSIKQDKTTLRNEKVWGCTCYVLDPRLQDGKKIPK